MTLPLHVLRQALIESGHADKVRAAYRQRLICQDAYKFQVGAGIFDMIAFLDAQELSHQRYVAALQTAYEEATAHVEV